MVVAVPLDQIPVLIDGLPPLAGWEDTLKTVTHGSEPVALGQTNLRLQDVSAAFAIALHMHQPTIPAGANGELINHLQHMFEHPYDGDNHNAGPFAYCYARLGDFIPELIEQGCNPRVMLDYSGTLLWGFQQMGRHDILDKLRLLTCDPAYQPMWNGSAPSGAMRSCPPPPFPICCCTYTLGSITLRPYLGWMPGQGEGVFAPRDESAESPRYPVRLCQSPAGLRLPVGDGARAYR